MKPANDLFTIPSDYEVIYFETVRLSRVISAVNAEDAIRISEEMRENDPSFWESCAETALGTNGVEQVWNNGTMVWVCPKPEDQ